MEDQKEATPTVDVPQVTTLHNYLNELLKYTSMNQVAKATGVNQLTLKAYVQGTAQRVRQDTFDKISNYYREFDFNNPPEAPKRGRKSGAVATPQIKKTAKKAAEGKLAAKITSIVAQLESLKADLEMIEERVEKFKMAAKEL